MPVIGFAAKWLLRVATGASIWGVYEFETNDIGKSDISGLRLESLIVKLKIPDSFLLLQVSPSSSDACGRHDWID